MSSRKSLVIIGTSGSTDYLKDTTGDRRYWPVTPPDGAAASIDEADASIVKEFVEMTSTWIVEPGPKVAFPNDLDSGADLVKYDAAVHRDEP
jgi:predicted P-loop ATPase